MRIAVIGAGIMGTGIAQVFAECHGEVVLHSRSRESLGRARQRIAHNLNTAESLGHVSAPGTLDRIRFELDLEQAVRDVEFVSENVPEDLALKQVIFQELDHLAPADAILSTDTSGLSITAIASATTRPERVVGCHWLNPAHLMVPVEVIPGERTSPNTLERIEAVLRMAGRVPIRLQRDAPGFVWSRLQMALLREAIDIVEEKIATPDAVDYAVEAGLGLRWAAVGPFRILDLVGLETFRAIATNLYPKLSTASALQPGVMERLASGTTGARAGRGYHAYPPGAHEDLIRHRDRRLVSVMDALSSSEKDSPASQHQQGLTG